MMLNQWQRVDEIRWDEFVYHVENKHIDSVTIKDMGITGKFNDTGLASRESKAKVSFVVYYIPEVHGERLQTLLEENNIKNDIAPPRTWLINLISMFLPIIILVGLFYFLFARNLRSGAGGMLMSFGPRRRNV
jgi:ATP-dependent Zn protease